MEDTMIIVIPSVLCLTIFLFISLFLYMARNPEKIDKWAYIYNKYKFKKDEKSEKKVISKNLDYKISSIAKQINKEAQGILPFGLRIRWRKPEEVESFVQNDEVVVVMKKQDNCDKNIVEACMAFVPKALIPKSRNCIDSITLKTMDHYMVRKILSNGTYDSAYSFFLSEVYENYLTANPVAQDYVSTFEKLNEIGFFTRILLEEYRRMGVRLYGTEEETQFRKESLDFLKFLKNLAFRNPGDNTTLAFNGERIKIGIILVAKKGTYIHRGIDAYIRRIDINISSGIQRMFVLSYAQRYDEVIEDAEGYVAEVKRKKDFVTLNLLEQECRKRHDIRLIKKQRYRANDVSGNQRSAKYLLYEVVR